MTDLNSLQIVGNLTRDAELKYTPNGMAVAKLSIAVNRSYKNKSDQWVDETSFFDVEAWAKLAERLNGVQKGQRVLVVGSLKQETWEKDGDKQSKVKIIADSVELIQRREKQEIKLPTIKVDSKTGVSYEVQGDFTDDVPF
jgi:single-strand DNA-binding protein